MNARNAARLLWTLPICAVATLIFLIRLHGGTDLESYGQPANIGYLLDLTTRGNYFIQHDLNSIMMTSPPFHTWLMAPFTALFGLNRAALALPSFLSVLAIALLVFAVGRRRFGELAGGLSAMAFLLSPATAKQIALVGADPVFALAVAAAVLAASGRLSYIRDGANSRRPIAGFVLFIGVLFLWLLPAGFDAGFGPVARMLLPTAAGWQAGELWKPVTALLLRYLPFSLFVVFALWRVVRQPAASTEEKRFERLLSVWLIFGLLFISFSASSGTDPLFALWPAGALLAGREMARLAERMGKTKFAGVAVIIGCLLVGATYNAVLSVGPAKLGTSVLARELQLAADAESAGNALKASGINVSTLVHLNTPKTLQLYLGTFRPLIDRARLAELLAATNAPLDLATDGAGLEDVGGLERFPNTQRIFRWPADESLVPVVQVYRIAR